MVARIERRLREQSRLDVFQHPQIAVDVIAFYLMPGGGGAPEEAVWKLIHWTELSTSSKKPTALPALTQSERNPNR